MNHTTQSSQNICEFFMHFLVCLIFTMQAATRRPLLIEFLHMIKDSFQMLLLPWSFSWSHCRAAFPFCDPPCCFCGTTLLLIYHLCMGFNHQSTGSFKKRWWHTSSQPALALSFIHRRLSINVCWAKMTSFFIIQENLLWSHLRHILIASKNNLGRSAHRGLMIPGRDVFPNT